MNKLNKIFRDRPLRRVFLTTSILYLLLFLYSSGDISLLSGSQPYSFIVSDSWQDTFLQERGPFMWEAVAAITLGRLYLALSPMNMLLGILISLLVSVNLVIILYSRRHPGGCPLRNNRGVIGIFTGLLGGFACCVPTFIIILGPAFSWLTIYFIRLRVFFIPITLILLIWGALWGIRKIE